MTGNLPALADNYTLGEQAQLLDVARRALVAAAAGEPPLVLDINTFLPRLHEQRACFVTLYFQHELRGCTGTLVARQPLVEEVAHTMLQTALHDPRFAPVMSEEVPEIAIEISVLTPSVPLKYNGPDELLRLLRPNIDGVTLRLGYYRSTFLPQVWERVQDPAVFLGMLSRKMDFPEDTWRRPDIIVETYQTVNIEEPEAHRA